MLVAVFQLLLWVCLCSLCLVWGQTPSFILWYVLIPFSAVAQESEGDISQSFSHGQQEGQSSYISSGYCDIFHLLTGQRWEGRGPIWPPQEKQKASGWTPQWEVSSRWHYCCLIHLNIWPESGQGCHRDCNGMWSLILRTSWKWSMDKKRVDPGKVSPQTAHHTQARRLGYRLQILKDTLKDMSQLCVKKSGMASHPSLTAFVPLSMHVSPLPVSFTIQHCWELWGEVMGHIASTADWCDVPVTELASQYYGLL